MSKKDLPQRATLRVKILSPTQTYYDGAAVSVSATNDTGPFDILEDHANFFSLLQPGTVEINTGLRAITLPINQGIIKVHNNTITMFVDISAP